MPFTKSPFTTRYTVAFTYAAIDRVDYMHEAASDARFLVGLYPTAATVASENRVSLGFLRVTGAAFNLYLTRAALTAAAGNGKTAYDVVDQIILDYLAAQAAQAALAVTPQPNPPAPALTVDQAILLTPGLCQISNDYGNAAAFTGATLTT